MLLAIKSEEGKGVYFCKDKAERNLILQKYPGCSNRFFNDNENKAACKWAGVANVVNEHSRVESQTKKCNSVNKNTSPAIHSVTNDFMCFIEHLKKTGVCSVSIKLADASNVNIIINEYVTILEASDLSALRNHCDYSHEENQMRYVPSNTYIKDTSDFETNLHSEYEYYLRSKSSRYDAVSFTDWMYAYFNAFDYKHDLLKWYDIKMPSILTTFGSIVEIKDPNTKTVTAINVSNIVSITPDDDNINAIKDKDISDAFNRFKSEINN